MIALLSSAPDSSRMHGAARTPRRGVAMLLVLISLMMATILATAYLASRDNSAAIGSNVSAAAAARWTADSGLEIGIAVLQTESGWRTSHVGGRLVSNLSVAGGTANIDLVDIETGLAPNASTEYVRMTATGTVDGVNQTAVAECHVPVTLDPTADIDLSEFSLFARTRLTMKGDAVLARWPKAPLSVVGTRVLVGTQASTASSIVLDDDSAAVDTTVIHGPGVSATLVSVANSQPPEQVPLLDAIPLPAAPGCGVASPPGTSVDLTMSGGTAITNANTRWKKVEIKSGATRMLRGNITVIADDKLEIRDNSKLIIDGAVKLVIFGDLKMDKGAIELKSGASLVAYVLGSSATAVDIKDSYVGELRATPTIDTSGMAAYINPERIVFFSNPNGSNTDWDIHGTSAIKASIYAPDAEELRIRDQSALYGRIAASEIKIENQGAVFYDPGLNSHAGFATPTSPIFDADGRIKTAIKSLTSLDTTALQSVADAEGLLVTGVTLLSGITKPTGYLTPGPGTVSPTDPTPRPIEVSTKYVTFGSNVASWE